jgi:hypothetical protein
MELLIWIGVGVAAAVIPLAIGEVIWRISERIFWGRW